MSAEAPPPLSQERLHELIGQHLREAYVGSGLDRKETGRERETVGNFSLLKLPSVYDGGFQRIKAGVITCFAILRA